MKKLFAAILTLVMSFCCVIGLGACGKKLPVIGINQFGDFPSLNNCREGFIEGLRQEGLVEGEDYELDLQYANFDAALAGDIANSFAAKNVKLMCGIATPSSQACLNAAIDYDIPVIYTAVSDPVGAKLTSGNITGTSDELPVREQLEFIRKIQPDAKKIGIVYSLGESNSVSTLATYVSLASEFGFTIESSGISNAADVATAVEALMTQKKVDCFSNMTDNAVVGVLPTFLEHTNAKNIPVYGSEIEQVKDGSLAGVGIDYVKLGIQTGKMAAKVFKGEKKASEIPFEKITNYDYYVNSKVANSLSITFDSELMKTVVECSAAD